MSHYFVTDKKLKDDIKTIKTTLKNSEFSFKTNAGVFSKDSVDYGTRLLIETIKESDLKSNIADVGCGYGPIGIVLAKINPKSRVFMYDINENAVELAKENALFNGCFNVEVKHNNVLEKVNENFDLVVTNPPIRAGKKIVFKIYEQAYKKLNEGGSLYVVIQRKQGAPSSVKKLEEMFQNVEIMTKSKGYWIINAKKVICLLTN